MSVSSRPYKSRLFNFFNRQSLQFRDRVGETFRHLKVAVEWGTQLLISPLYWIFQPKWTGATLGKNAANKALPVSLADTYLSDPPVDQPLENVFMAIAPLFELPELPTLPTTVNQINSKSKKQIVLSSQFFEQIQQQIESSAQFPGKNLALPFADETKTLTVHGLNQLANQVKNALSFAKPTNIIIHGIASVRENRQLVLTTTNNEILDILSLKQQKTLTQLIRTEMANYWHKRRLQWSISKKKLGFIPLIDKQTDRVLPPVQFLWRALYWLETQDFSPKLQALQQSKLVPLISLLPEPQNNALIQKLDQRVAALENQEIKLSQKVFQQLEQGLQNVQDSQLVISSLEKTGNLIQQIDISQQLNQLKQLNTKFLEQVSGQLTRINLSSTIAFLKKEENQLVPPNGIEINEPDPFQIQVLIQAAIAYFFGQKSSFSKLSSQEILLGKSNEVIADPWLTWEDLFIDQTTEIDSIISTETIQSLPLKGISRRATLRSSKSNKIQKKSRKKSRSERSNLVKMAVSDSTITVSENLKISNLDPTLQDKIETTLTQTNFTETALEIAPDWIETEAKSIGYLKHPLEQILEWLDIFILWFEESLKKIWHWLQHRLQFKS